VIARLAVLALVPFVSLSRTALPFVLPAASVLVADFAWCLVGYIKEGVALQTQVYKGRLHAGQYAGDAPIVNGPCKGVLVFAFVIDFRELIVFKNC
jgi:hypothetical protein